MNDKEVFEDFEQSLGNDNTSSDILESIARIEDLLEGDRWPIKRVHVQLEDLYGRLNQNQQRVIENQRENLQSQYEIESSNRGDVTSEISDVIGGISEIFVSNQGDRFVKEAIAEKNSEERANIEGHLKESLSDLYANVTEELYDIEDIFRSNTNTSEEIQNLIHSLDQKGWSREDLSTELQQARSNSVSARKFFRNITNTSKEKYCFLAFIPNMVPDIVYQMTSTKHNIRVYPSEAIKYRDLPNSDKQPAVRKNFQPVAAKLLAENSSLRFDVESFGRSAAKSEAEDILIRFLDCCASVEQGSYIEDPQYTEGFEYLIWKKGGNRPPLPEMTRDAQMPAFPNEEQMAEVDELLWSLEEENHLAFRLKCALHYFRKGNISHREIDRAVNYIVCLETLATSDYSKSSEAIGNALTFAEVRSSKQKDTQKVIEDLYDARNTALHSGEDRSGIEKKADTFQRILSTIIYRMKDAVIQRKISDFSDFVRYTLKDNEARKRNLHHLINRSGLSLDNGYQMNGQALFNDEVGFSFEGSVMFEDDGLVVTTIDVKNIRKITNKTISSKDIVEIKIYLENGKMIDVGRLPAGDLVLVNSTCLYFSDVNNIQ